MTENEPAYNRAEEGFSLSAGSGAIVGIVPTEVTAENGPIGRGDLLVTASIPGHAMKGADWARLVGAVVGKALEALPAGTGAILALVTLH